MTKRKACADKRRSTSLLDLPESIIISILRFLPVKRKCQAEVVCKTFREVLSNPAPGGFVWDELHLDASDFQAMSVHALNRWLLRRAQGILTLCHGRRDIEGAYKQIPETAKRDHQIVLATLPLLSGLLAPGAGVHLDLDWVLREALFTPEEPNLESQYWSSMSTVLTYLNLTFLEKNITKETSAVLCQLTKLQSLELYNGTADIPEVQVLSGFFSLDLPLLEYLEIEGFGLRSLRLNCPVLDEVNLHAVGVKSFCGMPGSVRTVSLNLTSGSMPLQEIIPAHSAKSLETLYVSGHSPPCTDPEAVKEMCLNGKLTDLTMNDETFHAGAFSVGATWRAVPDTLQYVTLELPLNKGIPRILEQIRSLRALSLTHSGNSRMHLDRPLNPFLDMPKLEKLELQSFWMEDVMEGAGMCTWTPAGLRILGLAEKRIRQMQMTPRGRFITLAY